MYKHYWLYQARGTPEPWAVHIVCDDLGGLVHCELTFYAEYIRNKDNRETWRCAAEYNRLISVFEQFSSDYEKELTLDDIKQVNGIWVKMARDFDLND